MTREYTVNIHRLIHAMGFAKCAPWALGEIWKFAMKDMGISGVHIDNRLNKAVWAKEKEMSHTVSVHSCPEKVMRMKSPQTRSIHWFHLSPL